MVEITSWLEQDAMRSSKIVTSLRSGRPIVLGPVHLVVGPATCAVCHTQHGKTEGDHRGIVFPAAQFCHAFPEQIFPRSGWYKFLAAAGATGEPESRVFPCGFAGRLTRRNLCVKPGLTRRGLRASHHHWRGTVEQTAGKGGRCEQL